MPRTEPKPPKTPQEIAAKPKEAAAEIGKADAVKKSLKDMLGIGTENTENTEQARAKLAIELMGTKNINRITSVNNKEIALMAVCAAQNTKAKSMVMAEFLREFKELRISRGGKGWDGLIGLLREQQEQSKGWLSRFFG